MTCTIDWGATAAWAQAFLTVAAVFAAAWLQDRAFRKRDLAALRENREAAITLIQVAARRLQWLADSLVAEARVRIIMSGRGERALAHLLQGVRWNGLPGVKPPELGEHGKPWPEAQGIVTRRKLLR